ncbi:hypothetical protein AYO40_02400 [Planctomycetaceae bacterium SCGC AG-212-D15]|nr:hypothetical protein AYO40_02400 [Planctomycetaceae bacterium SCGC AG-212-D15]
MQSSLPDSSPPPAGIWHRSLERWQSTTDGRRALTLGIFCAAMFVLVNWRGYHQDVVPLAFAPVSMIRYGTVSLEPFRPYYDGLVAENPNADRWAWSESNGRLYSEKSMFVSMLAVPFYLPPVLAGVPTDDYRVWIAWGRLVAAALTGLTVSLVYLTLRRRGEVVSSTAFALLFAFGTCVWTIIGQTLYDHEAVLFVAVVAWLLHDFPLPPGRIFLAALAAGAAVVLRPCTVVLLFPLGLYLLIPGRLAGWRGYLAAFAGILPFPLLMALANTLVFGAWYSTGYPPSQYRGSWRALWPEGAAGLLIAPNSGLFIQSPFLLLAVVGAWVAWGRSAPVSDRGLLRAYSLCFVSYWALFAKWHDWQGGLTFTSRMLSEGYPLWMPLVMVGWNHLRRFGWALRATAIAGAWSFLYELVNITTFDRTNPLNAPHLPWTVQDHFFVVHWRVFGAAETLRSVLIGRTWPWEPDSQHGVAPPSILLFTICAVFLVVALRAMVTPAASEAQPDGKMPAAAP